MINVFLAICSTELEISTSDKVHLSILWISSTINLFFFQFIKFRILYLCAFNSWVFFHQGRVSIQRVQLSLQLAEYFIYIGFASGNWINYWLFLIQSGFSSPPGEKETFFFWKPLYNQKYFPGHFRALSNY